MSDDGEISKAKPGAGTPGFSRLLLLAYDVHSNFIWLAGAIAYVPILPFAVEAWSGADFSGGTRP